MMTSVRAFLMQHPENPVRDTEYHSRSDKKWTKSYPPIPKTHLTVHTQVTERWNDQGNKPRRTVVADFDSAFLPEFDDDELRLAEPAYPPNFKSWRLASEADGIHWFHTEISNIVLAAWAKYPQVCQMSEEKPLVDENKMKITVDVGYSIKFQRRRVHLAIGEFKRGILNFENWQNGTLAGTQQEFSRELRAYTLPTTLIIPSVSFGCIVQPPSSAMLISRFNSYAHKYECPQIFCFDHEKLLMLQFRAHSPEHIKDADCHVDCWILPRENPRGTPLRYALYRFLVQGFRRVQGYWPVEYDKSSRLWPPPLYREFFSGKPVWKVDEELTFQPWGCHRVTDRFYGAFCWVDGSGGKVKDQNGSEVWDTRAFWGQTEPDDQAAEQSQP